MNYNYKGKVIKIDDRIMEKYCAVHHNAPFDDNNIDTFIYNSYRVGPISTPVEFEALMKSMTPEMLEALVENSMQHEIDIMW